jgi:hypothetical protein
MQRIITRYDLKSAIQLLELKQTSDALRLKDQFYYTLESMRPINFIKRSLNDLIAFPNVVDTIVSTTIGLGTGYLSKKIIVGTSGNIFRKLLGLMLQIGVTEFVSRHPEKVKSLGQFIFQKLSGEKELNRIQSDR